MFGIFKKNKQYDLKWLGVDVHSHLLPGIDDGSPDAATSLTLMAGLQELGYHTFFATPHVYSEIYPNTPETILPAHQQLQAALEAKGMADLKLYAAAEYMIDDQFASYADQGVLLTLPDQHVLIEMSYQYERQDLMDHIFQLQLKGYKPILAHPERYKYYHQDYKIFKEIKDRGCALQVNLLSLSGYYGDRVRKTAYYLVKEGMVDFLGTDIHHVKHLEAIRHFVRQTDLQSLFGKNYLRNQLLIA